MKDNKLWYEKISIWITSIAGVCAILGISIFGDIALIHNNKGKREELHKQAEEYYINQEYEKMMNIYSSKIMRNDPITSLNIGVMYANGLYFSNDEQQATIYFNKALEEGETYYSILYLMQLYTYDDIEDIKRIIKIGCKNNNKYCEKILQKLYQHSGFVCSTDYLSDFNAKTDNEQNSIIDGMIDIIDQYKYKVATNYNYNIYNDENGEVCVDAEAIVEERAIDIFVNDYFKIDEIQMVF